jgi:protein HOOK3
VNLVEKDSIKALEILKESDELVSHSLQVELEAMRKEVQDLRVDVGHKNAQLMDALLSKDELRKKLDITGVPAAGTGSSDLDGKSSDKKQPNDGELSSDREAVKQHREKVDKLRALATKQKAVCTHLILQVSYLSCFVFAVRDHCRPRPFKISSCGFRPLAKS